MARAQVSGLGDDFLTQRAADVLARGERAGRLGRALARMVRDLADAHRLIAILRRENTALRARLACVAGDLEAPVSQPSRGRGGQWVWGEA